MWKKFVFNEEMTSKMSPATGYGTVTERTWDEVLSTSAFVLLLDLLNYSYPTQPHSLIPN